MQIDYLTIFLKTNYEFDLYLQNTQCLSSAQENAKTQNVFIPNLIKIPYRICLIKTNKCVETDWIWCDENLPK
jgi:hypothetical protein